MHRIAVRLGALIALGSLLSIAPRLLSQSPAGNRSSNTTSHQGKGVSSHRSLPAESPSASQPKATSGNRSDERTAKIQQNHHRLPPPTRTIHEEQDLQSVEFTHLTLNPGRSFGKLRLVQADENPNPRDIVLYESLPRELPRVAGIITSVRQTPLSEVNLQAIQYRVPNAFVAQAAENKMIKPLLGKWVSYIVTNEGVELREASPQEVGQHFSHLRPEKSQIPKRELTVKKIRSLKDCGFKDGANIGAKASNLAALRSFDFPMGVIPDGFAVPFYFYDEFMKHNHFYDYARHLLGNEKFQQNREVRSKELKTYRTLIKKGKIPAWMEKALSELQEEFAKGVSIRCRSSTNNENIPGFSGAGLYDSYTHHPDEGHLSKSVKQVYASLWNLNAFDEREFHRVDHFAAAMGVLVHPSFKGELANGVAVTNDILYRTKSNYYVNVQAEGDLSSNPNENSIPEKLLIDRWDSNKTRVIVASNRDFAKGSSLLPRITLEQLRQYLEKIHREFARLYNKSAEDPNFAMEIEFKLTEDSGLAIKQARRWIFP